MENLSESNLIKAVIMDGQVQRYGVVCLIFQLASWLQGASDSDHEKRGFWNDLGALNHFNSITFIAARTRDHLIKYLP